MTKASDNAYPSILITEGTEPSAPAAGKQRLYIDSTTHKLKRTDSSGTDVDIEGVAVFSGAKVYNNGTQSVNSGAETIINFGGEEYDTDTYHDNSTNNSRLTVPTTAKYRFTVICPPAGNALGGTRVTGLRVNGAGYVRGGYMTVPGGAYLGSSTVQYQWPLTCDLLLTAADYVEAFVYHNVGSAINYGDTDTNKYAQCAFSVERLD